LKKIVSLLLVSLIMISLSPAAFAKNDAWEEAYNKVILNSSFTGYVLFDASGDGVPELFCNGNGKVLSYYYKDGGAVKASENSDVPFDFFENLTYAREEETNTLYFMGQATYLNKIMTYKMSFPQYIPMLEIIAEEDIKTGSGVFKGEKNTFSDSPDVETQVLEYLQGYTKEYLMKSILSSNEIYQFSRRIAARKFLSRYRVLSSFSDDSMLFSSNQREQIKKSVGMGKFLSFDRISVLSDDYIFIEFYVNNTSNHEYAFNYDKRYALVSGDYKLIQTYRRERDIAPDYLESLISAENSASNFNPDYEKTNSFRGIDDYVTYFSSILSSDVNEKGKKEIVSFMEYAANRCSRTEIKATNNTLSVKKDTVSFVSQSAVNCMGQLESVCTSKNISQIRIPKTVPELVCSGVDITKPVRIEFETGVSKSLNQASGIRIMFDETHGIYVNTAELIVLEKEIDIFSIEFTKNKNDYSIVFTGKNNVGLTSVPMPVWFILPSRSNYASVLVSYEGGTENRGGQFDKKRGTIEFSVTHSGNYEVVEDDITINDIDSVSFSANEAIRFLVSKGILEVDRNKHFYPEASFSKYEFTKALVKMFYAENDKAKCSYPDIEKGSKYYKYVATAEELGLAYSEDDGNFNPNKAVTNEYITSICAKVLTEKKGYNFPVNYDEYISFSDKYEISEDKMPYIAVAIQCGLLQGGGAFLPKEEVTKEKGAEILYKAFMLLYDTSPVTTSFSAMGNEQNQKTEIHDLTPLARLGLCIMVTLLLVGAFFIIYKRKNKSV